MPSRIVREGLLGSEPLSRAGELAEVLFTRLLLVVDDYGRFEGRVSMIKSRCWPQILDTDPKPEDISERLQALTREGLVIQYQEGGKSFIYIPKFRQRLRLKNPSKYPDPPDLPASLQTSASHMPDRPPPSVRHLRAEAVVEVHSEVHANAEAQRAGARTAGPPDSAGTAGAAALEKLKAKAENLGLDQARIPGGDETPSGRLAEVLLANGCKGNSFHPLVVEWAREGVTVEQLQSAIATARQRPGKAKSPLVPAYLDPILQDVRKPDPSGDGGLTKANHRVVRTKTEAAKVALQPRTPPPAEVMAKVRARPAPPPRRVNGEPHEHFAEPEWWETPAGIQREADNRGVERIDGEAFPEFKARVFAAAGEGPWLQQATPQLLERVQHYRAHGVNP